MKKIITIIILFIGLNSIAQCPELETTVSNPYYVLFTSNVPIDYTTNITINGLDFVGAGTYLFNGIYYASWINTSGTPLDMNNFTVTFGNITCLYPNGVLGTEDYTYYNFPLNRKYKAYDVTGKLLKVGLTSEYTFIDLPKNKSIILVIKGYKPKKLYVKR